MPDELRSPIKHHLVLHRRDPDQGVAWFSEVCNCLLGYLLDPVDRPTL